VPPGGAGTQGQRKDRHHLSQVQGTVCEENLKSFSHAQKRMAVIFAIGTADAVNNACPGQEITGTTG